MRVPLPAVLAVLAWLAVAHAAAQAAEAEKRGGAAPQRAASATTATTTNRAAGLEAARRLFEDGRAAYARGELPLAREHFLRAFDAAPSPELAFNLARACERLGDRACALERFRYYLRHGTPAAAERARIEARLRVLEGELAEQEQHRTQGTPSDDALTAEGRSFFMRGLALYERRRYRAAYQAFVAARRFAPTPEVLYNLARTAERLGRPREASDLYGAYLRARPKAGDRERVQARITELRAER